jgi:AraC family transcriptional regulator, regulatory protein of adaptative response / methylated-DNA-[protein]-cysteine methyltransferase
MASQSKPIMNSNMWRAVLARDSRRDREFVYAVRSTGIYCKPSCPSRRPRRAQVAFFAMPVAAEHAGFRPCKRCKPELAAANGHGAQTAAVVALCRSIEQDPDRTAKLSVLAKQSGTTTHRLHRAFRHVLGITPRQFADALRLKQLKGQLQRGGDVTTALYDAGYGSASRLYERANAQLGMTPATYGKGGKGMDIAYTIEECSLGKVLVAATARGISAVYLGGEAPPLERALKTEYPNAYLRRDANSLGPWVRAIVKHLDGGERRLDLPTDVEATAFQRRVWEELRKIPYGTTKTYSQVARAIGKPAAVRAVARACAMNPVSIVVPCHRVIREDGTLAGYRWGLDRKKALLQHEQSATKARAHAAGRR